MLPSKQALQSCFRSRVGRFVHRCFLSLGLLAVGLLFAHPAQAIHGPGFSGSGYAGSPNTISASTMSRNTWYAQVFVDYLRLNTFSDAEFEEFIERGVEDVHDAALVFSTSLSVAYGVTPNLTVSLRTPYVVRENVRQLPHGHDDGDEDEHGPQVEDLGDSRGLGDTVFFGQYRFFDAPAQSLESALLFGVEMPTGATNERAATGDLFEAELQPGSGSWDPMLGVAVSKRWGKVSVHSNVLYFLSTQGTQDTRLGDTFYYNAAVVQTLLDGPAALSVSLEGNGVYKQKEEVDGESKPNSGGNIVLLSPGMVLSYGSFSGNLSVGIPIVQDLNGVQNDVGYRLLLAAGYSF